MPFTRSGSAHRKLRSRASADARGRTQLPPGRSGPVARLTGVAGDAHPAHVGVRGYGSGAATNALLPTPRSADYAYMNPKLAKVVALLAVVVLAFLVVGWCRNLGPDEEKARREVARVIPEHIEVVSITGGDCGWGIAAPCSIGHTLRADPAEYIADGRLIRANLLANGWTETGYGENDRAATGSYRKGSTTLSFRMTFASRDSNCPVGISVS